MIKSCKICGIELPYNRIGWRGLCQKCWNAWYIKYLAAELKEKNTVAQER